MVDHSNFDKDFEMPIEIMEKWHRMVNILSNLLRVPIGSIMKVNTPHIQIFTTNTADTNPYHAGQNFRLDGLYCEEVMKSDNLLCIPDALKDPEWADNPQIPAGIIYYLGYPIHWPTGEMFGTICIQDYENNLHATDNKSLLEEFRSVCELDLLMVHRRSERKKLMAKLEQEIVVRKETEDELKRSKEAAEVASQAIRKLSGQLLQSQEDDRRYIARELHDELGQTFTSIRTIATLISRQSEEKETVRNAKEISQSVETAFEEIRNILDKVSPHGIAILGLLEALKELVEPWSNSTGVNCTFNHSGKLENLPYLVNISIYRVVQECLTNVSRHTNASQVEINLLIAHKEETGDYLQLDIHDDGQGTDLSRLPLKGLGLIGIQERVNLVNGVCSFDSSPGKGMHVAISIPLND